MTLYGDAVLDISQHFIERWNEVKKRKVCYLCNIFLSLYFEPLFSIDMMSEALFSIIDL